MLHLRYQIDNHWHVVLQVPRSASRNPSQRPSSINERLRPHPADVLAVEQIEGRWLGRKSFLYLDNILHMLSSSPILAVSCPRRALW